MAGAVADDVGATPSGVTVRSGEAGTTGDGVAARGSHGGPPALEYRPALDGLRAVAVLAVMAEHGDLRLPGASAPFLPGGFLGVDVFLVISGFLITSLLLVEHRRTGSVDLRAFWLRRARRLLPAVVMMVAGTATLIAVAGLEVDTISARGDALAALGYVANWRFVLTEQSYFASFGLPSPFRHLWSLSLEEQWYLVFPPLLVGARVLARRRPGLLLAGLLTVAAASAAWMAAGYTPGRDPSRLYYGTDTRAHTLLVGAALAVVMVHFPGVVRRGRRVVPVLAVGGVAVLAHLFHTVDGRGPTLYRGGFLLVALVSAAVVAGVALPGVDGPVRRLLARRGPVAVGRISYGLYLWHWPLFVWLTPRHVGLDGALLNVARFGASFAVAVSSYVLVEQPIRRHGLSGLCARARRVGLPNLRPRAVTGVVAVVAVAVVLVATSGPRPEAALSAARAPDGSRSGPPVTTVVVGPDHPLPAVPDDRDLRVLLGGDSVAWSLGYSLIQDDRVPDGMHLGLVAQLGCTVTPGIAVVNEVEQDNRLCPDWRDRLRTMAFDLQPDLVVALWGAWEVFDHRDGGRVLRFGTPDFAAAYQRALADSIDATIAVAPDTRFAFLTVPCMEDLETRLGSPDSPRNDPDNLRWINDLTAAVVDAYGPRAMVVDLGPLVCRDGRAVGEVDGVTTRDDGVHFTGEFAPEVWRLVREKTADWLAEPAISGEGWSPPPA